MRPDRAKAPMKIPPHPWSQKIGKTSTATPSTVMPMLAAKAIIRVHAGIVPGSPMTEYSRHWSYSSEDFELDLAVAPDQPTIFSKLLDEAHDYAKGLSNPAYTNWVRVECTWI